MGEFNRSFSEQIKSFAQKSQNFKMVSNENGEYLKGILPIPNDDGEVIGNFSIEIHGTKKFPFAFPILFEVGEEIPNEIDWHKYPNHSCCLTVEPDEILLCVHGITIDWFIKCQVIPYLANYLNRKTTGVYKNGDYAHGYSGNFQFYEALFKTKDKTKWLEYIKLAFNGQPNKIRRNDPCLCGSGIKYKKCHDIVFAKLRVVGLENLKKHLNV